MKRLALVLVLLAGCGEGESDDPAPAADDPARTEVSRSQLKQAQHAVERVASKAANRVSDRYLKGPKKVRAKCKADGQTQITCNVVAYARPQAIYDSPTAPYNVAIADENWVVSINGNRLGSPRIGEAGYAIGNFLEADDYNGCSAGKSLNC